MPHAPMQGLAQLPRARPHMEWSHVRRGCMPGTRTAILISTAPANACAYVTAFLRQPQVFYIYIIHLGQSQLELSGSTSQTGQTTRNTPSGPKIKRSCMQLTGPPPVLSEVVTCSCVGNPWGAAEAVQRPPELLLRRAAEAGPRGQLLYCPRLVRVSTCTAVCYDPAPAVTISRVTITRGVNPCAGRSAMPL